MGTTEKEKEKSTAAMVKILALKRLYTTYFRVNVGFLALHLLGLCWASCIEPFCMLFFVFFQLQL